MAAASGCAVIEFSERLSYFGLATNLFMYLTEELHEDLKTAAKNVNYWSGVTAMMPLVGGFVADAALGRFFTVIISSLVYIAVKYRDSFIKFHLSMRELRFLFLFFVVYCRDSLC